MFNRIKKIKAKVIETIPVKPGCWDKLKVGIYENDTLIGSYFRNYDALYNTFFPFICNGKMLALYSKSYTSTRIMELPSCKDIGGEKDEAFGFCPVDYFVPHFRKCIATTNNKKEFNVFLVMDECEKSEQLAGLKSYEEIKYNKFGFVAGCIWGDDCTWKIQHLDLSQADKGIIKRDERYGYIELPNNLDLKKCINMDSWEEDDYERIRIITETYYDLDKDIKL